MFDVETVEDELHRKKVVMRTEYESSMAQLESITKQAQQEIAHQREIEQMKTRELEKQKKDLEKRLQEETQRYKDLDKEFQTYVEQHKVVYSFSFKLKTGTTPEAKLQTELIAFTNQRNELQRKLEVTKKKKRDFKEKYLKAREEIEFLKQQSSTKQEERLRKEQKELETIRMRYLAKENGDMSRMERQELDSIKMQLRAMQLKEEIGYEIFDINVSNVFQYRLHVLSNCYQLHGNIHTISIYYERQRNID